MPKNAVYYKCRKKKGIFVVEIQKIKLCPERPWVELSAYLSYSRDTHADAILVCPGGGYGMVCENHEGEAIALSFAVRGFRTFVLKYSVGENAKYPTPLIDASLAIAHIKDHAEEYGIDPSRVFVMGFSAGGHLAGALGTLWHKDWLNHELDIPYGYNKPAGMILSYPVISCFPETHMGTFKNALGMETPTEEAAYEISLDKQVDGEHTVPAFIWHTMDDELVHVENSLRMISSLRRHNVYTEAHLFPHGPHGMATADKVIAGEESIYNDPRIARWVDLAADFMRTLPKK